MSGEERVIDNTSTHFSPLLSGAAVGDSRNPDAPWHLSGAAVGMLHISFSQRQFGSLALVHYDIRQSVLQRTGAGGSHSRWPSVVQHAR
jgi:hypothetical protein